MKKRDLQIYKDKPLAELKKELEESRGRLSDLRFNLAAGKVKNIKEIHQVRKHIARLLTFIRQQEKMNYPNKK